MLKTLEQLQNGQGNPKTHQATITMHRIYDLELSNISKLEPCHNSGIRALDLERVEERFLLSGSKNGDIFIHDLWNTTGKSSYTAHVVRAVRNTEQHGHKYSIVRVQWYPYDTGLFMTSGMDHKLKLWDTTYLKPVDSISMEHKIKCHHMSTIAVQHHTLIAVAMKYPHIVLLDPRSGSRSHELRGHRIGVNAVRWSPLSEFLLASGGADNKIFFWDIRSAKNCLKTLDQHNAEALNNKRDLITAHDGKINSLRFTENGLHLVSHGTDHRLRLWDVALCKNTLVNFGTLNDIFPQIPIDMELCCDSIEPVLFVPCNDYVNVYELFSGCKIKTLNGHFNIVSCCVFRSSTHELYSSGSDMNILLWTSDGKKPDEISSPRYINQTHSDTSNEWSSDGD